MSAVASFMLLPAVTFQVHHGKFAKPQPLSMSSLAGRDPATFYSIDGEPVCLSSTRAFSLINFSNKISTPAGLYQIDDDTDDARALTHIRYPQDIVVIVITAIVMDSKKKNVCAFRSALEGECGVGSRLVSAEFSAATHTLCDMLAMMHQR